MFKTLKACAVYLAGATRAFSLSKKKIFVQIDETVFLLSVAANTLKMYNTFHV